MAVQPNYPAATPSLLLDFANNKRLDPRITFTRTTTATYYDGATTAKAEENLVTYSQEFDNAAWAKVNASITANSTTAPDGTSTADSFVRSGTVESVVAVNTFSSSANTYVVSVFAKASTQNFLFIQVNINSAAAASFITFDLTTGSAGTQQNLVSSVTLTASSVSVGSGWYRCIVSYTGGSTNSQVLFGAASAANVRSGTNGGIIFLWGAQLEQRSSVTAYTATTTQPITNYIPVLLTAASGVARFDHNPTTDESLGLLIEEARTNLLTYSEDFGNAAWTKTRSSVTANTIVAPDGTLTGSKLVEDTTASNTHLIQQLASFTSGTSYTFSFFLKGGERTSARFQFSSTAFTNNVVWSFNTVNGVVTPISGTAGTTAAMTNVGNGWYRCRITATATVTISSSPQIAIENGGSASYTGDGTSGIYIWGAQLEAGAFATSYIPTVAAQVTRNADAASMTGSNFTSWYNAAEGTFIGNYSVNLISTNDVLVGVSDGTSSNFIELRGSGTNAGQVRFAATSNGVTQVDSNSVATNIPSNRLLACCYKLNDYVGYVNGSLFVTDTTAIVPVVSQAVIGNSPFYSAYINGTIKKLAYYPTRLTNANLQALTS